MWVWAHTVPPTLSYLLHPVHSSSGSSVPTNWLIGLYAQRGRRSGAISRVNPNASLLDSLLDSLLASLLATLLASLLVGRLLEQTADSGVVREFLRMFASEAKQPRNDNRDSSRTYLAMNLGTRNTTYKKGGRPAGARNTAYEMGGRPAGACNVLIGMCKSFEGMWPKSVLRNIGGHPPGYRRGY